MIVTDTHALLWWINGSSELSRNAQARMQERAVCIAAITCWEIAFLVKRRRIAISNAVEWFDEVLKLPAVVLQPLTMEIAATAAGLSDTMRDPADCLIVATALHQGVPLVTKTSAFAPRESLKRSGNRRDAPAQPAFRMSPVLTTSSSYGLWS